MKRFGLVIGTWVQSIESTSPLTSDVSGTSTTGAARVIGRQAVIQNLR